MLRHFIHPAALVFFGLQISHAQNFKILHYTETSGYDHNTRQNSLAMFQSLGAANNFTVDNDNDGAAFNSLANLQQYAVIVFSNTSGDNILDSVQKNNFENYINGGGSLLGIHAASDTYRHSTANGGNTGAWDWYAGLLGASVQQNPNHVAGTPAYNMYLIGNHYSTANLPNPWLKNEEYYYWENGYYNHDNEAVLEVEETVGPNGQVNSFDSIRPMSWVRELSSGGRVFYTALGHSNDNYLNDQNFINHIRDALLWAAGFDNPTLLQEFHNPGIVIVQSSEGRQFNVRLNGGAKAPVSLSVYDLYGKIVKREIIAAGGEPLDLNLGGFCRGMYLLQLNWMNQSVARKILVN